MRVGRRRALVAILLVASACSSQTAAPSKSPSPTPGPQHQTIGDVDAIVRGTLDVTAGTAAIAIHDNFFMPNVLTAPAGSKVTFSLTNEGGTLHNFSVVGQPIDQDFQPGTHAGVDVTVPASGSVTFFCKYHKLEAGMVGTLQAK